MLVAHHLFYAEHFDGGPEIVDVLDTVRGVRSHHKRCLSGSAFSQHDQFDESKFERQRANQFFQFADGRLGIGHPVDRHIGLVHFGLFRMAISFSDNR